jgi:CheY-like chemotaxis protein
VTESRTARDALEVLQQERPDVLISDLSLPGEDGFRLIRTVRELSIAHGGGTPAAALTGHVTAEDRAQVLRAGFSSTSPSPWNRPAWSAASPSWP